MLNKKTDYISWIALIGILLLIIEITFFHGGLIFSLIVSGFCIYMGRKRLEKTIGKLLFWFGWISFVVTVLNMMALKFLMIALLVYFIVQFFQSKNHPLQVAPVISELSRTELLYKKPLFDNILFGQQRTPERVYEWNDINIQCGIGDTVIDFSNTVLPKGEAVVSIRNFVGNIKVLIPYETELCLSHSVITGSTSIFEHHEPKMFNQTLHYTTPGYEEAGQRIKIITSMLIGDIEVKRI